MHRTSFGPLVAAALLLSATACTDPPAPMADVCPVAMTTAPQVPVGDSPLTIGFVGAAPAATSIDRSRETTASVVGSPAGRARASFRSATAQPDPNAVAGTLSTSLDGGVSLAEVRLVVPLTVAGVATCGTASTRVLPATPPSDLPCADAATTTRDLQSLVDRATLSLRTPDARLFTRVPLTPMAPDVTLPDLGRLSGDVLPVPLPSGTTQVRFRVEWGIEGALGFATSQDGRTAVPLGSPSSATSIVLRALPPVVAVPDGDASPRGAVRPRVTARVHASVARCNVSVSARTPATADAPAIALPLPRVLALYRAPDMVTTYPAWRTAPPTRNSGVVVFGSPTDLAAPSVPLASLIGSNAVPASPPRMDGLGQRLAEITGPVPTPYGTAGLSELPAAVPDSLVPQVDRLRRLTETISLLTRTYGALAAHRTGSGTYARLHAAASVSDLGSVNIIDGESGFSLPVHVQDEAEAAILLGPSGSAADLYTLANFVTRIDGPVHTDMGVARVTTAREGYVAVLPDLAMAGPRCGTSSVGWLPNTNLSYAASHTRPADDRYGNLRMHVALDGDRGVSEAPDVRRESVPGMSDAERDQLNRDRSQTMSRTMSSLRIGDTGLPITGNTC